MKAEEYFEPVRPQNDYTPSRKVNTPMTADSQIKAYSPFQEQPKPIKEAIPQQLFATDSIKPSPIVAKSTHYLSSEWINQKVKKFEAIASKVDLSQSTHRSGANPYDNLKLYQQSSISSSERKDDTLEELKAKEQAIH